ncbi:MAG TPA: lysylphosphatidylglycerol synthase transmembrane domain-containing protein [Longimicrobiales bacterium]
MRGARRRTVLDWKAAVGLGLGIGLLIYSLRGVDPGAVLAEIGRADPWLLLLGVAGVTAPMAIRAWRWKALLEPVRRDTAFRSRFRATMIGFMANNLLPARVGEFARAYALSRLEPVPVVASLGTLVLERIFDGVVVIALLFLAMAMPGFPSLDGVGVENPAGAARVLAALLAAFALGLAALVARPRRAVAVAEAVAGRVLPAPFRRPLVDAVEAFLAGIGSLRDPALLLRAAHWSVWTWIVPAAGFWYAFRAFGIDVPFAAALFLQSLIALAVALPAAPGFFGLWEAAARIGLHDVYGVGLDKAIGFAIGFHLAGFLSVTIWGLVEAWRLGLSWQDVEASEATVESAIESAAPPPASAAGEDRP